MAGNFSLRAFQSEGSFFELGTSDLSSRKSTEYLCLLRWLSSLLTLLLLPLLLPPLLLLVTWAAVSAAVASAVSSEMALSLAWWGVARGRSTDEKGDLVLCCCSDVMKVSVEERVRPGFLWLGPVDLAGSGEEAGDGVVRRRSMGTTSSSEGKKI
jgi:hypothetical protein